MKVSRKKDRKPVWTDEDDDKIRYVQSLVYCDILWYTVVYWCFRCRILWYTVVYFNILGYTVAGNQSSPTSPPCPTCQVDGQVNPLLQSIHLERFPICSAHFSRDGEEVIMAGQRKSFFVYDMVGGKITRIHGIRGTNFTALRRSCFYTHQKICFLFLAIQVEMKGFLINLSFLPTTSYWSSSARMAICLSSQTR